MWNCRSPLLIWLTVILFIEIACRPKPIDPLRYSLVATEDSIIIERQKIEGLYSVRPQYFYDSTSSQGYFYAIKQAAPAQIMKYADKWGEYQLLDSIEIPTECTVDGAANLGAFAVLGLDSFAISPDNWTYSHRYILLNATTKKIMQIPKEFQGQEGHMLWGQFDYIQAFYDHYHTGRFYVDNKSDVSPDRAKFPKICIYNLKDTSEIFLAMNIPMRHAGLEKNIHYRIVDNKIYAASGLEHKIYMYDLKTNAESEIALTTKYLKKKIDLNENDDFYKALYESDHIKQVYFNPFYEDWIFLEVHEGDEYVVDGYRKSFTEDATIHLLIFDRHKKAVVGSVNLPNTESDFHLFHMQPAKDGFYVLKRFKEEERRYDVYKRFKIQALN